MPDEDEVDPPATDSEQPYFTSWLTQQLVDRYRAGRVFGGGLKIKTTIDPELQAAAEQAIAGRLAGVGPDASLVAIENKTGEVKAMVGGSSFNARPFNLATNGHRQPGSAFKPFILLRALSDGVDPNSVWASQPKELPFIGKKGPELFKVSQLRGLLPGLRLAVVGHRRLRQLGVRRAGHEGQAASEWRGWPTGWASAPSCPPTRP